MFSSSCSDLRGASSPSFFLLSSTWVAVLEPASYSLDAMSSMSFFSMVRLFSALDRLPRSTASSSSSSSSLACIHPPRLGLSPPVDRLSVCAWDRVPCSQARVTSVDSASPFCPSTMFTKLSRGSLLGPSSPGLGSSS